MANAKIPDNFFTILHDRLSILDLSSSANQPMTFENLIISYNGEIYNFKNLKKELINDGYKFITNSDKYFNFDNIQKMLLKHQREYYNPALIWSLINLQLFLRKFRL